MLARDNDRTEKHFNRRALAIGLTFHQVDVGTKPTDRPSNDHFFAELGEWQKHHEAAAAAGWLLVAGL